MSFRVVVRNGHGVRGVRPAAPAARCDLGAALAAADAAGLADQAQEHVEIALGQARDVPIRLLQPTVLYWYGRALARKEHEADRARGRGMVQAALEDFRSLEMVLHAQLAEQFLRSGSAA